MNLKMGVSRKQSTPNFPKNERFLAPCTLTYTYAHLLVETLNFEIRPFTILPTNSSSIGPGKGMSGKGNSDLFVDSDTYGIAYSRRQP